MNTTTDNLSPPRSVTRNPIQRHPLTWFFCLAILFSWIALLPLLLSKAGVLATALPITPFQIFGAMAGPTLSALIVLGVTSGSPGIRQLLRRCVRWRVSWIWYLVILFGPLIVLTLTAALFLGYSVIGSFLSQSQQLLTFYLPALLIGVILGPLWEEPGWRGFALPRLQKQNGPLVGTLFLGAFWAAWHLPGYFGGWMGTLSVSSFLALLVGSTAFSILMTWVYNNAQESVLLMILMHSASNASISFGGLVLPAEIPAHVSAIITSGWIPAIAYTIPALLILLATKGRLSYEKIARDA